MALLLAGHVAVRDWRQRGQPASTWGGLSADALRGWLGYIKFALPSCLMLCAEWWTFECSESGPAQLLNGATATARLANTVIAWCFERRRGVGQGSR